jgi:hypothetical protein
LRAARAFVDDYIVVAIGKSISALKMVIGALV